MAAVRRSGDSGVIVALVLFVVLAFAGIGCAVWFYQQLSLTKQAIVATQDGIASTVQTVFDENTWDLSTQDPSELGEVYVRESFEQVAAKLRVAAEYEGVVMDTLGWESLGGMQNALQASPAQREAEARGEVTYKTLSGLLQFYELRYESLTAEVDSLRGQNADLSSRLAAAQNNLVETQKNLGEKLNQEAENFKNQLAELRKGYNELDAECDEQRTLAVDWQDKYQKEVNLRKQEVANLQKDADQWKNLYAEATAKPAEKERLVPDGRVISLDTQYDFVYIEGGRDRARKENAQYVVFARTPAGEDRKKGAIFVGQVRETVSRATVAEEVEGTVMLEGDYFVSLAEWERFHSD